MVERFNRTLGNFIKTARSARDQDIMTTVIEMVGAYNSSVQATTGRSPHELLHGRKMNISLDLRGTGVRNQGADGVEKMWGGEFGKRRRSRESTRITDGQPWIGVSNQATGYG